MRIMLAGNVRDQETTAEPFTIEGSDEQFAVHHAIEADIENGKQPWTATHIETGFAIARGDSIDEAIANARFVWQSKTKEEIEHARKRAHEAKVARDTFAALQA